MLNADPLEIPDTGPQCDTCFHRAGCPAHHLAILEVAETPDPNIIDAPALLSKWLLAKSAGAQLERTVRELGADVALVDGRVYGRKPGRRSIDDVPKALVECQRLGVEVDATSKLSLTMGAIEKAAGKRKGDVVAALEASGVITRGEEWGIL